MNRPSIRYTRVRKVKPLARANSGDAGLDFFFPEDLTVNQLLEKQAEQVLNTYGLEFTVGKDTWAHGWVHDLGQNDPLYLYDQPIDAVTVRPHARILIPSGIRVLLEPKQSMFMAANKSGVCTKKGLIFGAEIVDSPYTGEVHISLINTSNSNVTLKPGEKVVQFIHVPIFDTEPEEIPQQLYEDMAKNWGTRGDKGFGSSDGVKLSLEDELALRDAHYSI